MNLPIALTLQASWNSAIILKIALEENVAVIVSSHLLSEVELMCDRAGIIQTGTLVDIININDYNNAGKSLPKVFSVEPILKAKEILSSLVPVAEPEIDEDEISVSLDRELIPGIVEKLVNEGIRIYGICTPSKALEDKFLKLTGGSKIE